MARAWDALTDLTRRVLRWRPSSVDIMRVLVALILIVTALFWLDFQRGLARTIVVDAETGSLRIVLERESGYKALHDVWICELQGARAPAADPPPVESGCATRTHHWVKPDSQGLPSLPPGAEIVLTTRPGLFRIDLRSVPERYRGSAIADIVGGAIVAAGPDALDVFGTLFLSGKLRIGAPFREIDHVSIVSGSYQLRGVTPSATFFGDRRVIRSGTLLAGANVRFVDRDRQTATGHVAVMIPDPDAALMRVTAISSNPTDFNAPADPDAPTEPGDVIKDLALSYYYTEEVIVRPSFFEALLLDPVFQFLAALLGAFAGYGWLKRLLGFERRGPPA